MTENRNPKHDVERETGGRQAGRQDGGTGRPEQGRTPGSEPLRKGEKELQEVE